MAIKIIWKEVTNMYSKFQSYYNYKFADIYGSEDKFLYDYDNIGIPGLISLDSAKTLYFLLYAKYGNDILINSDTNQFKYKLFSIIWQYGPSWEKKLAIQEKLRSLSLEEGSDIYKGGKAIYNTALNPSTGLSANSEELDFINSQNTTNYKKSKLEGLAFLNELIEKDVTSEFLAKFNVLFTTIIAGTSKYYIEEEEEE